MRLSILHIALLSAVFLANLQAQISPGDLTNAHADLEGMLNCTQCHILGKKVSKDKCLACHKEIKNLIDHQSGYHASKEVRGKECAACHSEHHGRKFDMVRFDEDSFNHSLTGYKLEGKHQTIDCRKCHKPDFIASGELKKRKNTFLGLKQECKSCHADYHQNTLSKNCASCHATDGFSPATKFNHDNTDFALVGKHKEVDCMECHKKETRNGKDFQRFAGVKFTNCNSCHKDVHQDNLGSNCKACHTERSFTSLSRIKRFNHNKRTHFPLKGAHEQINCAKCHNLEARPENLFQDKVGVRTDDCISCHEDVHNKKFGSRCIDCHNEKSFVEVNTDNFDHNKTDFKLHGKHTSVDCRKCHVESFTKPLLHNECAACHEDYHEGQFASLEKGLPAPDCATCHAEDSFEGSSYTIEDHANTKFPLNGAHMATPCFACHLKEEKWRFREIGERCVDCHEDVHQGYIAAKYYPNQSCENCHQSTTWADNHFDHSLTKFKLVGAHAKQDCMACHGVEEESLQNPYEDFANLSTACSSCHENKHGKQFERNGITDCTRCHGFNSWDVGDFDHNKTRFKLEGKHAGLACSACHKEIESDGKKFTQYKFKSLECVVCHQ